MESPRDLKSEFPKDSEVELCGLAERQDYNGRPARIIEADNKEQRLIVAVDMGGSKTKKMRVHPENLKKRGNVESGEFDGPSQPDRAKSSLSYDGQYNPPPRFESMRTEDLREGGKEPCGKCCLMLLEWQLSTRLWYEKAYVQYAVTGLIIINFILILIGNTYPLLGQGGLSPEFIKSYRMVSEGTDLTFLIVFTVELVINFFAHYFSDFWRDGWNVFDFIIIFGSWGLMGTDIDASAIRIIRALRVTRLIGKMRSLRIIVNTLMLSLKSVGILFALLLLMMCIYSIMAITMVGSPMRSAMFSPCTSLDIKAVARCDTCPTCLTATQDQKKKCRAQADFISATCEAHNGGLYGCRSVDLTNDFRVAECNAIDSVAGCRAKQGLCKNHKVNNPDDDVDCAARMTDRITKHGATTEDWSYPSKPVCEGDYKDALRTVDHSCGEDRKAGCGKWNVEDEAWVVKEDIPGWADVAAPKCTFEPVCATWDDFASAGPFADAGVRAACLGTTDSGVTFPQSWTGKDMKGVTGGGVCRWNENFSTALTIMDEWNGTGRFDNLGEALYSFFTIVTFEAWPDIVAPIHKSPWPVPQPYGTIFFVSYILASAFLLMNMFVTIFLDKMTEAKQYVKDQDNIRAALIKRRKEKLVAHIKKIKKVRREILDAAKSGDAESVASISGGSARALRSELHNIDAEYREDLPTIAELKEIKRQGDDEVYDRLLTVREDDSVRDEIQKIKNRSRGGGGHDDAAKEGVMAMMKHGQRADRAAEHRGAEMKQRLGGGGGGDRDASYWNDQDERERLAEFMKSTMETMTAITGRLDGLDRGGAGM